MTRDRDRYFYHYFYRHTGGDYIVFSDCDEKTKKADLGQRTKKASYAMHFVAHMIESSFEVTEVKSGYCLFLIYTLWSDGEKFSRLMNFYLKK